MKLRTINNRIKSSKTMKAYWQALKKPVQKGSFLFEAGQGKNINGNIFALLRYLRKQPQYNSNAVYIALVPEKLESARKMMELYDIDDLNYVIIESDEYLTALATCEFLITDNSFKAYFVKRKEQTYINTWHGTPIKHMGRADVDNATSLSNVQSNMLKADYLLYPNTYTKEIMMRDYMVDRLFKNKTILIDYPRNDALYYKTYDKDIRSKYGLGEKRLIAYMPTWRGSGRVARVEEQITETQKIISEIDSILGDDEILCVNLHFLIGNNIDISELKHTILFPSEYETYDFLAICDTLITDYSSVAIDYAQTGKEIILYMYDYEDYKQERGLYFDINELPFKKAYSISMLEKTIHSEKEKYKLPEYFTCSNKGDSSKQIIELLCDNKTEGLDLEDFDKPNETNLIYVESLLKEDTKRILDLYISKLTAQEKERTVLAFENRIRDDVVEVLRGLDPSIGFIRVIHDPFKTVNDLFTTRFYKNYGLFKNKAESYYKREADRLVYILNIKNLTVLHVEALDRMIVLSKANAHTVLYNHPAFFFGKNGDSIVKKPDIYNRAKGGFDEITGSTEEEQVKIWDDLRCYGIKAVLKHRRVYIDKDDFVVKGDLHINTNLKCKIDTTVHVGKNTYLLSERNSIENKHYKNEHIMIKIPLRELANFEKTNRIFIGLRSNGSVLQIPIHNEGVLDMLFYKSIDLSGTSLKCIIRGSKKYFDLEIRENNVTDSLKEKVKIFFAWLCHLLMPWYKPIIVFEKECSRYEESASIVYESLIKAGYKNVFYILDKNYEHKDDIEAAFRKNILDRFSFKHYVSLFAARSFIATEALSHSLELNCSSKLFIDKILRGKQDYVFLQHGVMYMVSLNAEQRGFFRTIQVGRKQRVVVSSELEAKHFTDYTNYLDDNIYISGLPKFDKSILSETADKITVMLTWRPWEYNDAVRSFRETNYYKMLNRIIQAVPDEYKDKLIVLPHPRFAELASRSDKEGIWKYSIMDKKYDDILKDTKLLITDYSSISYDAFYRGSNVIFCWSEKDDCMKEYGKNAHLMLTEDLAFGPVVYDENITETISKAYTEDQDEMYVNNFRKIVQFNDNHNTDRVIEMMKKDGIV